MQVDGLEASLQSHETGTATSLSDRLAKLEVDNSTLQGEMDVEQAATVTLEGQV